MARFHLDLSAIPALNTTGVSLSGAKLDVFLSATTTRTSSWSAASGGSANANPVVANSSGRFPPVYLDADVNYRIRMTNSAGTDTMFDRNDINVSALPAGVATYAVLAGTGGAALIGTADGGTVQSWLTSNAVPNRVALAALPTADEKTVFLAEAGREGFFKFDVADYSAQVTADPEQGLYVAPASDTDGSTGAWVRVVQSNVYEGEWWGLTSATVDPQDIINGAFMMMPDYSKLRVPEGDFMVNRATSPDITPGSSSTNGGIISAIYLDKDGQELEGSGYGTNFDGDGQAVNCIMVRANHCRLSRFRAGNVAGQLITNEAAAIAFQPSNFPQGGVGADITDLIIDDVDLYDCDSGITGHPEKDLVSGTLYFPSKLITQNVRMTGVSRQGIEWFQCDDSKVDNTIVEMTDKGAWTFNRMVRNIGSSRTFINRFTGLGHTAGTAGYLGVAIETSGFYSEPADYQLSGDVTITDSYFDNCEQFFQVNECRGVLRISQVTCVNDHAAATNWGVRVLSNGLRDPGGADAFANWLFVDHLIVEDSTFIGVARMFDGIGRILDLHIKNVKFFANESTTPKMVRLSMTGGNAKDRIYHARIEDNESVSISTATGGINEFAGLNSADIIYFDDNKVTPDSAGEIISTDGTGTISVAHPDSNTELPHGRWAAVYDPPHGPL